MNMRWVKNYLRSCVYDCCVSISAHFSSLPILTELDLGWSGYTAFNVFNYKRAIRSRVFIFSYKIQTIALDIACNENMQCKMLCNNLPSNGKFSVFRNIRTQLLVEVFRPLPDVYSRQFDVNMCPSLPEIWCWYKSALTRFVSCDPGDQNSNSVM